MMKKSFFDVDEVGKVYLWCLIMPQILVFVAQLILVSIASAVGSTAEELLKITPIYIIFLMLAQVAFFMVYLMFTKKTDVKTTLKFNKLNYLSIGICILIGVVGLFGFSPLATGFSKLLEVCGYPLTQGFYFDLSNIFLLIVAIILIAGVPAVVEELIFRGIIFQGLRKFGNVKAILLTSLLFALVHLSIEQFIFPFIFSTILCLTVLKTNSIFSAIIIHFVSNATSILCTFLGINIAFSLPIVWYILVLLAIAIVAYFLILLLIKFLKNTEKEKSGEDVLKFISSNESKIVNYNNNTYTLKLSIIIGAILWVINLLLKIIQ